MLTKYSIHFNLELIPPNDGQLDQERPDRISVTENDEYDSPWKEAITIDDLAASQELVNSGKSDRAEK